MELKTILKNNALMIAASFVLVLTLSFSVLYKLQLSQSDTIIAQAEADKTCDLHKSDCSLTMPSGEKITLSIEPRPIPLLTKFNIDVKTESIDANNVIVDFQGTTMNMGLNRVELKQKSSGQFQGHGVLPVCLLKSMEWQAQVFVKTDNGMFVAPFIFVTTK